VVMLNQVAMVLLYRILGNEVLRGTRMVGTFAFGVNEGLEMWSDVEACKSIQVTVTSVVSASHFRHQFMSPRESLRFMTMNSTLHALMLEANPHVCRIATAPWRSQTSHMCSQRHIREP